MTVRLPLGDMTAGQMRVLADLAEAYGDGTMRLTVEQNVLFKWVKKECAAGVLRAASRPRTSGRADANTLGDVVSCPGAESCRLAVTQSRGLGRGLTEYLSTRSDLVAMVPREGHHQDQRAARTAAASTTLPSIGFQGSVRKVGGKAIPQ